MRLLFCYTPRDNGRGEQRHHACHIRKITHIMLQCRDYCQSRWQRKPAKLPPLRMVVCALFTREPTRLASYTPENYIADGEQGGSE